MLLRRTVTLSICGLITLLCIVVGAAYAGNTKVEICHIPPGNPANFHTITVSEKALPAHLAHGDFGGSCFESCETLCDDGNFCTIDACDEQTETCLVDHPPVDCDDSNLCTNDTCDPEVGCQSAPIFCDDGDACTVDTCNPFNGQCTDTPIECGALGVCLPETGVCDFPCGGITCDPIDQCHAVGECVLPGECVDGAQLADGTACNDGNAGTENDQCTGGVCTGTASCLAPVAAIGVSPQGGGTGAAGADDQNACNVNNIVVADGAVAGLDYTISGFGFGGLGLLPGYAFHVSGCVAADFGSLIPSGPVSVRAGRIFNACGKACGSGFCNRASEHFVVFSGSTLGSFTAIGSSTPLPTGTTTLLNFTFNVPANFRYVTVCRTGAGIAASDVMVDAIVVGGQECLQ